MSRQHFSKEFKQAGGSRQNVVPTKDDYEAMRANSGAALTRSSIDLTAELVEAFVLKYLHAKYDNPVPIPPFHREMWANNCNVAESQVLNVAPRGHGKSTANTEAYGLAALLFRVRDFAVVVSHTLAQSVEFLHDIKLELTENEELIEDFGIDKILRDREDDLIIRFKDGHKFRIVARGAGQEIRGLKWNKRRPNLILFDDLEGVEEVSSKERREKFKKWFMDDMCPAGAHDCLIRGSATIIHFDSLAENLTKDDTWLSKKWKAHRAFNDFSDILWPEQFSEVKLRKKQRSFVKNGNSDGYSAEYLNIPIAEGSSFFRKEDLLPLPSHFKHLRLRYYAAWDFAISQRQTADYTCGIVIGVDEKENAYVVDVRRDRWDTHQIVEEMFSVQKAWKCECHFAEAGTIEKALGPHLYSEMRRLKTFFNVEPVIPTKDKVSRAASWKAKTRAKTVYYDHLASWWAALELEMLQFPKGEHDDQVDPQSLFGNQLESLLPALTEAEAAEEEYLDRYGASQQTGRNNATGY